MKRTPLDRPDPDSLGSISFGIEHGTVAPIVYDYAINRERLFEAARRYALAAVKVWGLKPVTIEQMRHVCRGPGRYGYYLLGGRIFVNWPKATQPPRVRGRVWSYPGYKIDRTAAGITMHELGHHVYCTKMQGVGNPLREQWIYTIAPVASERVSGYEPNPSEAFAETFRVFALNPTLLAAGWPLRYSFITASLRLKPLHSTPWRSVLAHAPDFIKEAAEKLAARGGKE